jgi:hypothetical protein
MKEFETLIGQVWWPGFQSQRQEDCKFEANLCKGSGETLS